MRVSIIKEDGTVVKDGVSYTNLDLSALPSDFHALQWYGLDGDLETKDENNRPINTDITDFSPYQWCIDKWQEAADAYEAEKAAEAAAEAAAQVTAEAELTP